MTIKKGFWYARIILPLWFLYVCILTVFFPSTGIFILESYLKAKKSEIESKINELHK